MGINCEHEEAHSIYIRHVYNGIFTKIFLCDELFGVNRIISIEDKVDGAVKRVNKLTAVAKATARPTGSDGSSEGKRCGAGRRGGNNFNVGM